MHQVFDIAPYMSKLMVVVDKDPSAGVARANIAYQGLHVDWAKEDLGNAAITYERIYKAPGAKSTSQYIIVVIDSTQITPGLIAHEAVHVVNYIFKSKGVDLDLENDEPQAYLEGAIVDMIHSVLHEYKKPKKKK